MNNIILEEIRLDIKDKTKFDLGNLDLVLEIIDRSKTTENILIFAALVKVMKKNLDMKKHAIIYTMKIGTGAILVYRKRR